MSKKGYGKSFGKLAAVPNPPPSSSGSGISGMNDEWNTAAGDYDPSAFYCETTDSKGHGDTVSTKIPPHVKGMLMHMVSEYPQAYKNIAAVVRDAIRHRVEYLERNKGMLADSEAVRLYKMLEHDLQTRHVRESLQRMVDEIREQSRAFIGSNDYEGWVEWVTRKEADLQFIREPYRTAGMRRIKAATKRWDAIRSEMDDGFEEDDEMDGEG